MPCNHTKKRISIEELADYLGKHRNTIANMIKRDSVNLEDISEVLDFVVQNQGHYTQVETKKPTC